MSYNTIVLFDALRIVACFLFVFGWLGPKFLPHANSLKLLDRLIYSCVGLGGLVIVATFILTMLGIYDFISLTVCLLIIPFMVEIFNEFRSGTHFTSILRVLENRLVERHVRFMEFLKHLSVNEVKERLFRKPDFSLKDNAYLIAAFLVGAGAGVVRIIPGLDNSAPFTRNWYYELEAVKNLKLQHYFTDTPLPKGMHSIVQMFSTLTQVTPEMILHILGSLISFYIAVLIYWVIRDITRGKRKVSALFGMSIYAFLPTLLLPVSLDIEGESNSLQLALCFAIPTGFIFLRNIRSTVKAPWFYVTIGVLATALINIFVLIFILLPCLIFGLLTIRRKMFLRNFSKLFVYIATLYAVALSPYILYLLYQGSDISSFFEQQFYNTLVFSYFPNLILELDILAEIYLLGGIIFLVGFVIRHFVMKEDYIGDEIIFFILFCIVSYLYTPYFNVSFLYIDPDQLNGFFSFVISVFFGLCFYALFTFLEELVKLKPMWSERAQPIFMVILLSGVIIWNRGIDTNSDLPQTLPSGFFEAYYNIVNERLPYTYSTVSPEIDRRLAMNRHYFMNYEFFLDNYGAIDSLYQEYLTVPLEDRPEEEVPPASIFLFVEKPPYGSIQQGILYDASTVMNDVEQWLTSFEDMGGRTLRVYYESDDTIVYEIVNREDESDIGRVLLNTHPKEKGRASTIFN